MEAVPVRKRGVLARALFVVACALAGCGGGGAVDPPSAAAPPGPAVPAPRRTAPLSQAEYASVAQLPLADLGLPATLAESRLSVLSGPASDLAVRDGRIRFITPGDPGVDTTVVLRVDLGEQDSLAIPVLLRSARPTDVEAVADAEPEGAPPASAPPARLLVQGLGPNNAVQAQALRLSVEGAPALDPRASSATAYAPSTGEVIALARHWVHDPQSNTLSVPAGAMARFLATLPPGELRFSIGLTSVDGEFARAWAFLAHKPTASLAGQVVDRAGARQPGAAGRRIAVRGLDNLTRSVAMVAADGSFSAGPLGEGTYELSVLDVDAPGLWTATAAVTPGATQVTAQLPYEAPASLRAGLATPRAGPSAIPACRAVAAAGGGTSYSAVSGPANQSARCILSHALPAGSGDVDVEVRIATDEYPVFTSTKSRFNDTWSYAVVGLPDSPVASGTVNESHAGQPVITRRFCRDVRDATRNAPRVVHATLAVANVADTALPTTLTMTLRPACQPGLRVTQAAFATPNARSHSVIEPVNRKGHAAGLHVSIPIAEEVNDWGLPLTVDYEPRQAQVTGLRVGVMVDGQPRMADVNLLPAVSSRSPGRLVFNDLVLPRFPVAPFRGKTPILVELTGRIDGQAWVSAPQEGQVRFRHQVAFTPLFLADAQAGGARRYGFDPARQEAGRDSWARFWTLAWLGQRPYRYNDVSALHVAQTAAGRSVLQHIGHSDGLQLDLRYADGSGGFTDSLGGAGSGAAIKALLQAAAAEAVAGGTAPKPNLAKAVAWVRANRALLEAEAPAAVAIHAGPSWMKRALHDGLFPDGVAMPSVGTWTGKPDNLSFVEPHLHHWHISLKPD